MYRSYQLEQQSQQGHEDDHQPAGIYNSGNTCFVNSLLQALASLQSFGDYMIDLINTVQEQDGNWNLLMELHQATKKINNEQSSVDVLDFLSALGNINDDLMNWQQQDAHELYSAIILSMEKVTNSRKNISLTRSTLSLDLENQIDNPFLGYTKSYTQCYTCKNITTISIQPFYDVSLEIKQPFIFNLQSALQWYEKKERIEGWVCTHCSILKYQHKLSHYCINFKGQDAQQVKAVVQKINKFLNVQTQDNLQLANLNTILMKYLAELCEQHPQLQRMMKSNVLGLMDSVKGPVIKQTKITKYPKILVVHFKQLIINRMGQPELLRKFIDFPMQFDVKLKHSLQKYSLTSLLIHVGNQNMGHYYAFRKMSACNSQWYEISDSSTRKCPQSYLKKHIPYMLFYEKTQ